MEMSKNKIQLFENRKIRSVWDESVTNCHGFQKTRECAVPARLFATDTTQLQVFIFHPLLLKSTH